MASASPSIAADAVRAPFGTLADGATVEAVTLTNRHGISVRIMTFGATMQSLIVPDRDGTRDEITLGYDSAADYQARPQYFGVSVGRYANRIKGARFTLDGQAYQLDVNNGPNMLHGGAAGFDKKMWAIAEVTRAADAAGVTLTYTSADGEGGFPGTLRAQVSYTLTEANELRIDYSATTDKPTLVNLTNHAFFNLSGAASFRPVLDQRLRIAASRYTPVDATLIPTGELRPVAGSPLDFRTLTPIGAHIRDAREPQIRIARGFDHNYVIDGAAGTLRPAARVEDPVSGRVMELLQTAPGLQFYSGNFLDGSAIGRGGRAYRQGDAFALEPGVFPDAPNQPGFPSARLDPGQTYRSSFVLRFSTIGR